MPRQTHGQRDHQVYVKRESDPQLGAKRFLEITGSVALFYAQAENLLIETFRELDGVNKTRSLKDIGIRLYDDLDPDSDTRPAVKVFEKRLVADFGRRNRIGWTMKDIGSVQTDILNDIAKIEKPDGWRSDGTVDVVFDHVVRIGSGDTKGKRKIALEVDQTTSEAGFLVDEHTAVFEGIKRHLKGKSQSKNELTFPYGDFVPQMPLGIFDEGMNNDRKNIAIDALQRLLDNDPLVCTLEPLWLYSNKGLSLGPNEEEL